MNANAPLLKTAESAPPKATVKHQKPAQTKDLVDKAKTWPETMRWVKPTSWFPGATFGVAKECADQSKGRLLIRWRRRYSNA